MAVLFLLESKFAGHVVCDCCRSAQDADKRVVKGRVLPYRRKPAPPPVEDMVLLA